VLAAYCYTWNSVVNLLITFVSHAKMAEPIEMPFGMLTYVGPKRHVLDGVSSDESICDARGDKTVMQPFVNTL